MRLDTNGRKEGMREDLKVCKQCGRYLNKLYNEDICPECKDMNLFSEVKDYIRSNDVRESDVAEHFGIPIRKVRDWIREGRIQYKTEDGKGSIYGVHCQICGKSIDFGNMCSECRKRHNLQVVGKRGQGDQKGSMYFLGKEI